MSLEDIYSKQIQGTNALHTSLPTYGRPPIFERDPNLLRLEQDVFQQMASVLPREESAQPIQHQPVNFISFEDALKELSTMHN